MLWLLSGPQGSTSWISFAWEFGFVCFWVLFFALSIQQILSQMLLSSIVKSKRLQIIPGHSSIHDQSNSIPHTKWRNTKTKTKGESISVYFQERCGGGPKSKDFWPTIKPFLSQKSTTKNDSNIILKEGHSLTRNKSARRWIPFMSILPKILGLKMTHLSMTNTSAMKKSKKMPMCQISIFRL